MSDFRAIGGVSASLQRLLHDRMEFPDGVGDVVVSVGSPRLAGVDNEPRTETPRVNLFLYRVSQNGALANAEIPGNGSPGAYGRPPLSLDLHYLLTAFGSVQMRGTTAFDETLSHFLLGSAMRVLHDYAVVTDTLRTVRAPSGQPVLHDSLTGAYERVKLGLEPLSLEDVTKVWTALSLRYRLSTAYAVNVVQIESRAARTFPRPVGALVSLTTPPPEDPPEPGPAVRVVALRNPYITEIRVRRAGETAERRFPYARVGDTLVLLGSELGAPYARVALGELVLPATPVRGGRLEVTVPDAALPSGDPIPPEQRVQPGMRTVAAIVGDAPSPLRLARSNDAVVMIVPAVTPPPVYTPAGRTLRISGRRLIDPARSGETIVGRAAVPRSAYVTATPLQIVVPLPRELPARDVTILVSTPLAGNVLLPPSQELNLASGMTTITVQMNLPAAPQLVPREDLVPALTAAIHDANARGANVPIFGHARVTLLGTQLAIVPGDLRGPLVATASGGSTLIAALGLNAPQPAWAATTLLSGTLVPFPALGSAPLGLTATIGATGPNALTLPPPLALADAAAALQAALIAAGFAQAQVAVADDRLLVAGGAAGSIAFGPTVADPVSVSALQLHGLYAVRVRVNGAESFDDATVELPQ